MNGHKSKHNEWNDPLIDNIWSAFDSLKLSVMSTNEICEANCDDVKCNGTGGTQRNLQTKEIYTKITDKSTCKECGSEAIQSTECDDICMDCGLVQQQNCLVTTPFANEQQDALKTPRKPVVWNATNSRIQKMQEWYMWTNEEKNSYKLQTYTRGLCQQLGVPETLVQSICDTVVLVMGVVKSHEGTKRARVKDGIVIFCIEYNFPHYSSIDLAKRIGLDTKYITKAERLILELISTNKLSLNKSKALGIKPPFYYVTQSIQKNGLKIPVEILNKTGDIIAMCEQNDVLLDHTPLSIGACCLYYTLLNEGLDVDVGTFSEMFGLSSVTVLKTYNKLKCWSSK